MVSVPSPNMADSCQQSDSSEIVDNFREYFKLYKRRKPPPDFTDVIDFYKENSKDMVKNIVPPNTDCHMLKGLMPVSSWKVYGLESSPGLYFICNPFERQYQRYWIKRCLEDYHMLPNKCNLDAHMTRKESFNIWQDGKMSEAGNTETSLMSKLRWVTMGYHHNWDTKKYSHENQNPFPEDLAALSSIICNALGLEEFHPEASIINYYHMDSTLGPHVDHSEPLKTAPLISVSFGQTAVFLLGGDTKATRPSAMYIRSGDIVIMAGPGRLAYHAVPRIISAEFQELQKCGLLFDEVKEVAACTNSEEGHPKTSCLIDSKNQSTDTIDSSCVCGAKELSSENTGSCCSYTKVNDNIEHDMQTMAWQQFQSYICENRINMNIRQVLAPGQILVEQFDPS